RLGSATVRHLPSYCTSSNPFKDGALRIHLLHEAPDVQCSGQQECGVLQTTCRRRDGGRPQQSLPTQHLHDPTKLQHNRQHG
ncbi:unnamed protein product, partial [Laminaria digitata]